MKRKPLSFAGQIVVFIVIAIALFWVLFPFYWAFLNSVKMPAETFQPTWIPFLQFTPTLEHWRAELAIPEIRRAVLNSTLISVGAASLAVPLGTMAAYALARFRFRRPANGTLTTWFLSQRVMPPVLFVIPFFLIMRQLRLLDSVWALILLTATFTLPFPVIILSQMFRELPAELEDAARVDGASRFQAFYRIALPLVAPGLVATWILCLAFSWNEFLFALTYTASYEARTIPVGITLFSGQYEFPWGEIAAASSLVTFPILLAVIVAQKYLVRGLVGSGIKG